MRVRIMGGNAKRQNFVDDGAEIWALNSIVRPWFPRIDRHFNLHTWERLLAYKYDVERDIELAAKNTEVPFYTMDAWPTDRSDPKLAAVLSDLAIESLPIKSWQQFPYLSLTKMFARGAYHCGSFDWMIAFAISLGVERIDLHGIGMVLEPGEPISGRACLEYWCGIAEGRGIQILAARDCDLFYFYHLVKSNLIYSVDDTPIYEDRSVDARGGVPYTLDR